MTMKVSKVYRNEHRGVDWTWRREDSTGENSHCPDPTGYLTKCDTCDEMVESTQTARHGFHPETLMPWNIEVCDDCIESFARHGIEFSFVDNNEK